MKKGQSSLEGIFVVGAIFIIFLFILGYGFERRVDLGNNENFISQRDNCLKISNLIMGVFINGNGTEVVSEVDYQFQGLPDSRLIEIKTQAMKNTIFCTVPINSFSNGEYVAGVIKLKNIGDFVLINNV